MGMDDDQHRRAMQEAIEAEAAAQRAMLAGRTGEAAPLYRVAASAWRRSWEVAPPRSYGRLIGMIKASVLAGDPTAAANAVRAQIDGIGDSPPSAYAVAIAALVQGDDKTALLAADAMRGGSDAFDRTADAIAALAEGDGAAYADAVEAIVEDFEQRTDHLTGVPIADTALMLERIAEGRGLAASPDSPLLP
jgi:hypothetical protein